MKLGLLCVTEALNFLHTQAKLVHLGISPENIFLTSKNEWKLGGFTFSLGANPDAEYQQYINQALKELNKFKPLLLPNLNYLGSVSFSRARARSSCFA
jgi:SCY1-like protein 2